MVSIMMGVSGLSLSVCAGLATSPMTQRWRSMALRSTSSCCQMRSLSTLRRMPKAFPPTLLVECLTSLPLSLATCLSLCPSRTSCMQTQSSGATSQACIRMSVSMTPTSRWSQLQVCSLLVDCLLTVGHNPPEGVLGMPTQCVMMWNPRLFQKLSQMSYTLT